MRLIVSYLVGRIRGMCHAAQDARFVAISGYDAWHGGSAPLPASRPSSCPLRCGVTIWRTRCHDYSIAR